MSSCLLLPICSVSIIIVLIEHHRHCHLRMIILQNRGLALFFKKLIVSLYADAPSVVCMSQSKLECSNIVPFGCLDCLSRSECNLLCSFMSSSLLVVIMDIIRNMLIHASFYSLE